jgi:cell division protein ZapB
MEIDNTTNSDYASILEKLNGLENRITQLIDHCAQLQSENNTLKSQHHTIVEEHQHLLKKNELARSKIRNMSKNLQLLMPESPIHNL